MVAFANTLAICSCCFFYRSVLFTCPISAHRSFSEPSKIDGLDCLSSKPIADCNWLRWLIRQRAWQRHLQVWASAGGYDRFCFCNCRGRARLRWHDSDHRTFYYTCVDRNSRSCPLSRSLRPIAGCRYRSYNYRPSCAQYSRSNSYAADKRHTFAVCQRRWYKHVIVICCGRCIDEHRGPIPSKTTTSQQQSNILISSDVGKALDKAHTNFIKFYRLLCLSCVCSIGIRQRC